MAKVFIGVGHGGSDPGATKNGVLEKDLNLSIALACNEELIRHGVSVLMSRTKDENDTLQEEIKECNAFNPDLAIDIHNNAGGGDGAEAFYHYAGGPSKTLAVNVLDEIVKIGQNSRGAKIKKGSDGKDYYGFIRQTLAPAVIVECAFVDNAKDMEIIDTEEERKIMGKAVAKGILKTLGVSFIPEIEKPVETPIEKPEEKPIEKPAETPEEIPEEIIEEIPEETPAKINWGARIKNKVFWVSIVSALILLVQYVASLFGIELDLGDFGDKILEIVNTIFGILAVLGVVVDPTTKGIADKGDKK